MTKSQQELPLLLPQPPLPPKIPLPFPVMDNSRMIQSRLFPEQEEL